MSFIAGNFCHLNRKVTIIFESMTEKVEQVFLELAEEVIRTNPKTKQEFKEMIKEYSYKEDNKW